MTDTAQTVATKPRRSLKGAITGFVFVGLWTAVLFGSAGHWVWIRGWICLVIYLGGVSTAAAIGKRYNPTLPEARAKLVRSDTKHFDKVILAIYYPLTYVQIAIAGLDAKRFHWTHMPFAFVYVGGALFIVAMVFVGSVMATNRFAEATVRIQTDRGHTVCDSGPYRFVRHPMYVGAILMYISTPLILGSLWALAVGAAIIAVLVCRTALEDRTLRRELSGYAEFANRTRYRLMPGVW